MPPRNVDASGPASSSSSPSSTLKPSKRSNAPLHKKKLGEGGFSLLGDNFIERPLLKRFNYIHLTLLTVTPLLTLYGCLTTRLNTLTLAFAVLYYFITGLGITAGYHRCFSHRAFDVVYPVKVLLVLMGSGAVQGSVRWWSRDHRAHHKYVDTSKDPYAVTNGFFYAHIGWMLVKQDPSRIGRASITDLNEDAFIRFQHRAYPFFALIFGFLLPTFVCGLLWGDYRGGFYFAGVARLVFVHHSTFFVNSLAHYWGDSTYSDKHTAKNSWITALVTVGEGFHCFHHEFPSDYRNGVLWYHYDPTKWFIAALGWMGLATNLKRFPKNEILKGALQMKQKKLDAEKELLNWGPDPETLPEYTLEQLSAKVKEEKAQWIGLHGFVLDVARFIEDHPGGSSVIRPYLGKDASDHFNGAVYDHSNAARNLSTMYRVGRLAPAPTKED